MNTQGYGNVSLLFLEAFFLVSQPNQNTDIQERLMIDSDTGQREYTLKEWVLKLPKTHSARLEYEDLVTRSTLYEGTKSAVVGTVGGLVEGRPTHEGNYLQRLRELVEKEKSRDDAYHERNRLVALLAAIYPATRDRTDIPGWDPEWHWCIYIATPVGQMSWHIHEKDLPFFSHIPEEKTQWDGHTTKEKYDRVNKLVHLLKSNRRKGLFFGPEV